MSKEKFYSPIERKYVWFIEYNDGIELLESDESTPLFSDIQQDNIKYLGFQGLGTRIYIDNEGCVYLETKDKGLVAKYKYIVKIATDGFNSPVMEEYDLITKPTNWFELKKLVAENYHGQSNSYTSEFLFGLNSNTYIYRDVLLYTKIKIAINLEKDNPGIFNSITVHPEIMSGQDGGIYARNMLKSEADMLINTLDFNFQTPKTYTVRIASTGK